MFLGLLGMLLIVDTLIVYLGLAWVPMKKGAKRDIRERFGFAVKDRREALGWTQEEFAERVGLHRTYVSDIEWGIRNVSLINIERLAGSLSLSISQLFQIVERP